MMSAVKNKEQNYISAVVYVDRANEGDMRFFRTLNQVLAEHFLKYELIAVTADEANHNDKKLRDFASEINMPLTLVHMSLKQPHEQCMNAGLDVSIGDYVYEFDTTDMPYAKEEIWNAYELAMKGNDIVTVCPSEEKFTSKLFYHIFNRHSNAEYKLRSDAFRLVSRRAINRAHAISNNLPYRKATYAASGLKMAEIEFKGKIKRRKFDKFELAVDSLALYTDFGYKFSVGLTGIMLLGTLAILIYTFAVYLMGNPVSGWTTTMLVLTGGMTGMFALIAVMIKFLSLILMLSFKKQSYLVENVEKL